MRVCSRPTSSACCERIFSYLEHMDSSDRSNMSKDLLRDLLFLRGNHVTVRDLVDEASALAIMNKMARADAVRKQREVDVARVSAQLHHKRTRKADIVPDDSESEGRDR